MGSKGRGRSRSSAGSIGHSCYVRLGCGQRLTHNRQVSLCAIQPQIGYHGILAPALRRPGRPASQQCADHRHQAITLPPNKSPAHHHHTTCNSATTKGVTAHAKIAIPMQKRNHGDNTV
ncbi:hypothetical protein [Bordetella avium]|uniref:Phage-related protein n=1 Tax=Bordetella avium (strain 197N) TaxID=360910 RepID=Q2KZ04_BORA1|nr:hypothetical protein [Bordetella avium]RIQ49542.1 hypothetical protein D0843_13650 [Bordetella avium]CAJ48043.1 putative phage-related protein [Bordetella avium 197N]